MLRLVVGGCPSCLESGEILLRKCGYSSKEDYLITYNSELPGDKVFEKEPSFKNHVCAFLYDKDRGLYVNLLHQEYTPEMQKSVDLMFKR